MTHSIVCSARCSRAFRAPTLGYRPLQVFDGPFLIMAVPDVGRRKLRFKRRLVCLESTVIDRWPRCISERSWPNHGRNYAAPGVDHDGSLSCFDEEGGGSLNV